MARKTESASSAAPPIELGDEQVVAYLRAHPDFLARHPELVTKLAAPSRFDGGPVVDLQHYVIARLRDEMDQLRGCAEHLITTSRSNMSTQTRTHEAALAILGAGDMNGLVRVVAEDFPTLLDVDVATICFESGERQSALPPGINGLPAGLLETALGSGEVMLRAASPGDPALFGDGAGLVSSFALVRLRPKRHPPGLVALGSRNDRSFHSNQGTELLTFLARIIEDCVVRWWPAD
jgi:hypothetical protein